MAAAVWLVLNRQAVIDQARLLAYTPSAEIKRLAEAGQLSDRGRALFYVSDPRLQDSAAFNESCSSNEQTIVLGCYKSQRIYLYNVTDQRFNGVKEVTAAHEMLHAAYERLGHNERERVNAMLQPVINGMKDPHILDLIRLYNQNEPGQLFNEMHSILATEHEILTPELEDYYKTYFKDRRTILALASQYQTVFNESKQKIDDYDRELGNLKPQIDQNNQALARMQVDLEAQIAQLNSYRSAGQFNQYNQLVPRYNAKVGEFNSLIEQTKSLVSRYNTIVEERNRQVAAQADLYDSINSNYQPVINN